MQRLDQLLASLGYGSRREVKTGIEAGRATVEGKVVTDPGTKVKPASVRFDGEPLDHSGGLLILMNKPVGLVCSHEEREGPSVYDLLPERWRHRNPIVTSVGRLDKDTSGLLLLTDQSALVHRLTSPKHKVAKRYRAVLDRDIPADEAARIRILFSAGTLMLDGEKSACAPAEIDWLDARTAEVTLTEGRYHQVRRMFAAVGPTVVTLHRFKFGTLSIEGIEAGKWTTIPIDSAI